MHLGQEFPTPKQLFCDQKTLRKKNPFYLRLHLFGDPPHACDGCSGGRQEKAAGGRDTGCQAGCFPGTMGAVQCDYQPRESAALHGFTCTIHHLLTALFSLCTLVWRFSNKPFLRTVPRCANIALNDFSRKESSLFYTNCLACLLHRIMIQKEGDSSHAYS